MSKWKIYTPEGVQDILFNECYLKRNLEVKLRSIFRSSGYQEIETPTFEFYDVFSEDSDMTPQENMFKFFDQQGRILVLRPEMTIPVARISATKCKDISVPVRYSYIGNTFNYNELGGGKQKEFTQAGIEMVGVNTPEADAEVIATAITAVKAMGLESFQIDIGQVEFFKGLMEEAGIADNDIEQMRVLIDRKDFLGVEELVKGQDIKEDLKELIFSLPRLFGSIDVIEKVEKITLNKRSLNALNNLRKVLQILDDYGYSKYVSVDLGMVRSLNYYTGIIFRGFTYGAGFPILSGGRYDSLVGKFGKSTPAIGFSLGVNMIMIALDRQKIDTEKPKIDTLVCYMNEGRKAAFKVAQELRRQGLAVEIDVACQGVEQLKGYAASKKIGGIILIKDDENIEIHNLETGEASKVTFAELIRHD
ncbi:ATP phosphoribosyltransferase regulatory subunit [Pseudobacteroides cellulosolvens]|uniref:ATP phosphoribosyltransferase regulatory subunit n=1 Tax=Pseudobacteroides cellulosolvens ATCC 35603 = DSM 2933 TaxID=398512 RepID=A0A0L6JSU3_9FIRM|nr:ATP phosphoribosyltransferase regulatory subunit [Pseudobacteroides cellulosolvens]KNY28765.1 ATP phosphoribosyltransferase regulatory subunit [Pseudobacteroides cellulosolvens ATCC 35603 = DSM 2933]